MSLDEGRLGSLTASPLPRLVAIAGGMVHTGWQQVLDQHGLTSSGLALLFALSGEDALTHREAARRCWVSAGTLTGVVDGLERDGLVTRRPDEHDRRISRLALTPAGLHRVTTAGALLRREFGPVELTEAEAEVVRRYLIDLITRLSGGAEADHAERTTTPSEAS